MILLNSPSNPVGGVFTRQEIEALAALAREKGLIVVADEVYHRILFGDAKHYSIAALDGMADSTITINSFSKTYSMTGWRLGYVIASSERIGAMLRVHQQLGATCCSFGQYGSPRSGGRSNASRTCAPPTNGEQTSCCNGCPP